MKDLVSCVHIVAKLKAFNFEVSRRHLADYVKELKSVRHVKHDYFSSFTQSDHCFLASWSLLKLPICQRLRVLSVVIVSHLTYAASACYEPAFNKLKLHVIELDKVKELIYRSFLWTFLLEIGSLSLTIITTKRARNPSKNNLSLFYNPFWIILSYLAC